MPEMHYSRGLDCGSRRIFLAIPAYSGQIGARCMISVAESILLLNKAGISVDICIQTGNCHVDDARNAMVREFLMTDCSDMVFIDEDVGFDCADLYKLVKYDRDLVAGVYPCKQMDEEYPVRPLPGEIWADRDGLVEVEGAPTGFMRLSRFMLEKMCADEKRTFMGRGQGGPPHVILFERIYSDGMRMSGDYAFCHKWRKMGGKVFVDPAMGFSHTGNHTWSGNLSDFWKRRHGVYEMEFDRAFDVLKKGGKPDIWTLVKYWGNVPWAAGYGLLETWIDLTQNHKGNVLECGAGLTSLIAAANSDNQVYAIEHDPEWAGRIRKHAKRLGLENLTIIEAELDGWYKVNNLPKSDLILVDGPPRTEGDRSKISIDLKGATVVFDDMDNDSAVSMAKDLAERNGLSFELVNHATKNYSICRPVPMRKVA